MHLKCETLSVSSSSAIPSVASGSGGGWGGDVILRQVDLFVDDFYGDLIDNLPSEQWGMSEVCFLVPYPAGKVEPFVKQEAML